MYLKVLLGEYMVQAGITKEEALVQLKALYERLRFTVVGLEAVDAWKQIEAIVSQIEVPVS